MREPQFTYDPMREFGRAVDAYVGAAKDTVRGAARATDVAVRGRPLTGGELRMAQAMFGTISGFARARVYPHNFWWPYPNNRAMTPQGDIFFPSDDYQAITACRPCRCDFARCSPAIPIV